MSVLLVCICAYFAQAWYPQWLEDGVRLPGPGITDSCSPQCGRQELNMGQLDEQRVLSMAESTA